MADKAYGQQGPASASSEYASLVFVFQQLLNRLAGPTLVKVVAVSNTAGDIAAVGTVDVQPLVNQLDGKGVAHAHGVVHTLPYFRLQGGKNAAIIDPEIDDIGLACFASRDISAVKASKAQANPGSLRSWDWSDGLYLGGFLNGVPEQYVVFAAAGITAVSPKKITLQAPNIDIAASSQLTITSPQTEVSGNLHTPQTITADTDVKAAGKSGASHVHSDPQGGTTGPPQ